MAHTPGPWAIDPATHNKDIFVTAGDGEWERLDCTVSKDDRCGKTALANAKLIAAAPDLLAALKVIHSRLVLKCDATCMFQDDLLAIKAARAAIAKATE